MTKDELKKKLSAAESAYQLQKRCILVDYAKSNNPYKEGDIISDHIGKMKIREITYYIRFEDCECMYYGVELKKDGTPAKKQTNRAIYQSNIEP